MKNTCIRIPVNFLNNLGNVSDFQYDKPVDPDIPENTDTYEALLLNTREIKLTDDNVSYTLQSACWDDDSLIILASPCSGNYSYGLFRYDINNNTVQIIDIISNATFKDVYNNTGYVKEMEGISKIDLQNYVTEGHSTFIISGIDTNYRPVYQIVKIGETNIYSKIVVADGSSGYWQQNNSNYLILQDTAVYGEDLYWFMVGGCYFKTNISSLFEYMNKYTNGTIEHFNLGPKKYLSCGIINETSTEDKFKYIHFGSTSFSNIFNSGSTVPLLYAGHDQNDLPRVYVIDIQKDEIICAYKGMHWAQTLNYDFKNNLVYAIRTSSDKKTIYCDIHKFNKNPQ